jgi:hypothetical protein
MPYFSVPPIGGRKVAKIKYNNRFAIIISQFWMGEKGQMFLKNALYPCQDSTVAV